MTTEYHKVRLEFGGGIPEYKVDELRWKIIDKATDVTEGEDNAGKIIDIEYLHSEWDDVCIEKVIMPHSEHIKDTPTFFTYMDDDAEPYFWRVKGGVVEECNAEYQPDNKWRPA